MSTHNTELNIEKKVITMHWDKINVIDVMINNNNRFIHIIWYSQMTIILWKTTFTLDYSNWIDMCPKIDVNLYWYIVVDISCPTSIPNAILADRCIGHATGVCNFTCASGYEKTVDVLKCDDNGNWNQHVHTVCQSKHWFWYQYWFFKINWKGHFKQYF